MAGVVVFLALAGFVVFLAGFAAALGAGALASTAGLVSGAAGFGASAANADAANRPAIRVVSSFDIYTSFQWMSGANALTYNNARGSYPAIVKM